MRLRNWKATRSGANMRVEGIDADSGATAKITGIETIEPNPEATDECIAKSMSGQKHILFVSPA